MALDREGIQKRKTYKQSSRAHRQQKIQEQ